ncbi:hypothetical protein MHZ92_08125 [Sporosarcina sp. ACRSL]|uniref:hypothetical protein n=1 Tax=Sporosarcina sp. ACRSL TaxID=2918215 RepID=UPI001EF4B447|nr:hypothetical protein [Sporosarcina sp. ACRSL]MCG7344095.1 hypothetical protein [Sporosarcina sp. ACRSL]
MSTIVAIIMSIIFLGIYIAILLIPDKEGEQHLNGLLENKREMITKLEEALVRGDEQFLQKSALKETLSADIQQLLETNDRLQNELASLRDKRDELYEMTVTEEEAVEFFEEEFGSPLERNELAPTTDKE